MSNRTTRTHRMNTTSRLKEANGTTCANKVTHKIMLNTLEQTRQLEQTRRK